MMDDLLVIYDRERDIATIIHAGQRRGFGPAMIGEHAPDILQAFIDATPFDISDLGVFEACNAFGSFLERAGVAAEVAADAPDNSAVESSPSGGVDNGNALADAEAANATDVPGPQPADTDMEADTRTETTVVRCFNCEGSGMIEFGDRSPAQRCGMCGGTGKITQEVTT